VEMMSKRREWARSWPLPFIGMLGITGPAALVYSSGVFMVEITAEFGWSRAEFSSALTIQMLLGLVVGPLAGRLLDRVGSRRMLSFGILPFAFALSLFTFTSGALWQWWLLAVIYTLFTMGVIPAAWVMGAVLNFNASRGLALAIVLAGIGVATALWPMIAAELSDSIGWRLAFPTMAAGWALIVFPLTLAFFRPERVEAKEKVNSDVPPLGPILRSREFWCLLGAGGVFASVQLALIIHLVPMLRQLGLDLTTAASLAGLTGLCSIIGRVGTGFLLDWVSTRKLALVAFSLPLVVMAILASGNGSVPVLAVAAALLGLAAGSETDIVTYLMTRKFDPRIFGTVYSIFQAGFAICASMGPLIAGRIFDVSGAYYSYFLLAVPLILLSTVLIALVPQASRT
jgi:MFS family permease